MVDFFPQIRCQVIDMAFNDDEQRGVGAGLGSSFYPVGLGPTELKTVGRAPLLPPPATPITA